MDKEPERYYDWMLWKMRQEDKSNQDKLEDKLGIDKVLEVKTYGRSVNG